MKAKEYIPHTIEAEGITLPKELEELSELMAKTYMKFGLKLA